MWLRVHAYVIASMTFLAIVFGLPDSAKAEGILGYEPVAAASYGVTTWTLPFGPGRAVGTGRLGYFSYFIDFYPVPKSGSADSTLRLGLSLAPYVAFPQSPMPGVEAGAKLNLGFAEYSQESYIHMNAFYKLGEAQIDSAHIPLPFANTASESYTAIIPSQSAVATSYGLEFAQGFKHFGVEGGWTASEHIGAKYTIRGIGNNGAVTTLGPFDYGISFWSLWFALLYRF